MRYIFIFILSLLVFNGCSSMKAVLIMTKSTDDFLTLRQEPGIKYEQGAIQLANKVTPYLDSAIEVVETRQGKFPKLVVVYATESIDSFSSFCASKAPSACVIGDRLFLSPKLLHMQKRVPGILTHELSHLQLTQSVGSWNYQTDIPTWFKEGLAVYVSDGSGAEGVSAKEAYEAILQGKTIHPNGTGALLFRKSASSFGLSTHMFYRQSELFVKWLHDRDPGKFRQLFTILKEGKTLHEALLTEYEFDEKRAWKKFLTYITDTPPKKSIRR